MSFQQGGQRYFHLDSSGNFPYQPNNFDNRPRVPQPPSAPAAMPPQTNREEEQRKCINTLHKQNRALKERNQALEKECLDNKTAIDEAFTELKQEKEEFRLRLGAVAGLEEKVSSKKKTIKKRNTTIAELQESIIELQEAVMSKDEVILDLKKKNAKLEKALAGVAMKFALGDDSDMDEDME